MIKGKENLTKGKENLISTGGSLKNARLRLRRNVPLAKSLLGICYSDSPKFECAITGHLFNLKLYCDNVWQQLPISELLLCSRCRAFVLLKNYNYNVLFKNYVCPIVDFKSPFLNGDHNAQNRHILVDICVPWRDMFRLITLSIDIIDSYTLRNASAGVVEHVYTVEEFL